MHDSHLRRPSPLTALLLTATLTAPAVTAQVAPAHFANAEGNGTLRFGLAASSGTSRTMTILDELAGQPGALRGIALRRDAFFRATSASESAVVQVTLSTALTTAGSPDPTFDNNHGSDRQRVANLKLVTMPPRPAAFTVPAPFDIVIPFDQPFAFTGQGPLCVDIEVISRSSTVNGYQLDFVSVPDPNPQPPTGFYGQGCAPANLPLPATLTALSSAQWPTNSVSLGYRGLGCPANGLVSLLLGVNNQALTSGAPLPIALPGTASAPSGLCSLYVDPLVAVPGLANANGAATYDLGLPVTPAFNGLTVYGQLALPSAGANRYDLATTNAVAHNVIAPFTAPPVGSVIATDSRGPQGTATANQGLVLRIDR